MRVHHFFPHTKNIGDYYVRDGIRARIRECVPDAEFVDVSVNPRTPDDSSSGLVGDNVARANAEADLVIIGGSNLYEAHFDGNWGVKTTLDDISRLSVPVLLMGIGTGSRFGQESLPHNDVARAEILALNAKALGSSVRDIRTETFLRSLGCANVTMTGCPATFVFDSILSCNSSRKVSVSLPPIRFAKYRFTFFKILRSMKTYLRFLKSRGYDVVLSCHDPRDIPLAKRFEQYGEVFFSDKTQDFYELYKSSKLVCGYRLHASIISLSLGVPFIPIYFDHRGLGFLETYGGSDPKLFVSRWGLASTLMERSERVFAGDLQDFAPFISRKASLERVMRTFVSHSLAPIIGGGSSSKVA